LVFFGASAVVAVTLPVFGLYNVALMQLDRELRRPVREDYRDGGYFELEENGVIRIRFTVIPKLKKIQLLVIPTWNDDELTWQCHTKGDISQGVLPSVCRGT